MMLLKPARLRAARLMLPMMLSLVALSGLTLGLAPPVWAQSGGSHQVGDRLAGADKGGKTGFREISWDDLIPADWNPEKFLADLELDDLQDNDPRAMELMQRMREEWETSHDNADAVRLGLAGSGRVVVVAATIMTSVFLSFVPTPLDTIKVFGVALASAVIIDAFIVRLVLVPSLMSMFGRANWWLPRWLDRILPTIRLE